VLKKLAIVLVVVMLAHLWYRVQFARFGESTQVPLPPPPTLSFPQTPAAPHDGIADGRGVPLPLEEEEPPPPKKHFWNRKPQTKTPDDNFDDDIKREISPPGRESADAHFSGMKLFVWALVNGRPTCPPSEQLIADLFEDCNCRGFTIGEDTRFDICIVRVPPNSEQCPRMVFYDDGRAERPEMLGYGGKWQLPFIYARLPRAEPDIKKWVPSCRTNNTAYRPRVSTGWGPGIGVRYRSNTDIGVGLGFGSGWSNAPCGGT
jgi:hypothetical protein